MDEEINELRKLNDDHYLDNSNLKEKIQVLENENFESYESLKGEIKRLKAENMQELQLKAKLKSDHFEEVKLKDEKLNNLKKQIAVSFKDNSW